MSMIRPTSLPSRPGYRITPSLLNKWQDLVDADKHWEEWYGNSDEPSISSEDYYAKCETWANKTQSHNLHRHMCHPHRW